MITLSLFDDIPVTPPGFAYGTAFITVAEEEFLLEEIKKTELKNMVFHGYTANRQTANFGYDWSFENRTLSKGKEIPDTFMFLLQKVSRHFNIAEDKIAELLITYYPKGAVINWHRDAPPYDKIIGVSLQADCIFRFRPYQKAKQKRGSIVQLPVVARSVYIIDGEARSEWEHSILPLQKERYSITLRTLR